jgi:hypothetical protein
MTAPLGRLRVGPGSGRLIVRTRREGLAAKVGHDLTIDGMFGALTVPDEVPVEIDVDLDAAERVGS